MRIAVCDSKESDINATKRLLYEYGNSRRLEFTVFEFLSGKNLLASRENFDIIILDYMLSDINGLETAKRLRQRNPFCTIIFLTSYTGFIFDSFKVNPYRFLLKPLDKTSLFLALDDYFANSKTTLWVKEGTDTFCLKTGDIFYLEANNKKCTINLRSRKINCNKTMAAVYDVLPKNNFCKINRAFIVNLNYISGYNKDSLRLSNGEILHISRSFSSSFKTEYRTFSQPKVI